jgi:hypothetical protein
VTSDVQPVNGWLHAKKTHVNHSTVSIESSYEPALALAIIGVILLPHIASALVLLSAHELRLVQSSQLKDTLTRLEHVVDDVFPKVSIDLLRALAVRPIMCRVSL